MFKYLIFACLLAFVAAKPGPLYAEPAVSVYSGASPLAYSSPLTYSAPLGYHSAYNGGFVKPLAYTYPRTYVY